MDIGRTERAARNERVFRRVNERLHVLATIDASTHPVDRYVCECFQSDCSQIVELTQLEYQAVRGDDLCFFTVPDALHTDPSVEDVVERHPRYWVVKKWGDAAAVVER